VLLAAAIFKRLARAVLQELPAALKSKQGERFKSKLIVKWFAARAAVPACVVLRPCTTTMPACLSVRLHA
jgi:hypothetical protein